MIQRVSLCGRLKGFGVLTATVFDETLCTSTKVFGLDNPRKLLENQKTSRKLWNGMSTADRLNVKNSSSCFSNVLQAASHSKVV